MSVPISKHVLVSMELARRRRGFSNKAFFYGASKIQRKDKTTLTSKAMWS